MADTGSIGIIAALPCTTGRTRVRMAIPVVDLSPAEVASALATDEGHFSDVKAIEITPARLTKTMSAFANADAGELFVGVDEDRKAATRAWRGFSSVEDANGHLQAFEATFSA